GILSASEVVVTSGSWEKNLLTTSDTRPVWSGQATPDSTVRLYLSHLAGESHANNVIVTSTTADHNGQWSIQPESPLSSGNYTVQVRSINEAGLPTPHRRMMPSVRLGVLRIPATSSSKVTASSDLRSTKLSIPKRLNRNGIGLRLTDERQTFQPGSAN
ncbi:MAG: Bacterial Ig-like domain, partial [Planctomycetota bacterium]